jgi:hypothetical protein
MLNRLRWVVAVVLVVILLALAFTITHSRNRLTPGLTPAKLRLIRPGVTTLEETEQILGGPGDYDPREQICHWYGENGRAMIFVDDDGRVRKAVWHAGGVNPSPLDRLRAWLPW